MADYYVSPIGDDEADGLTEATAWATLDVVNGFAFTGGDRVLLEKDGVWREQLTVPSDHLVIGSYGAGDDDPVISASDLLVNAEGVLEAESTVHGFTHDPDYATVVDGNVYVWEDGVRLAVQASLQDCKDTPGSSFFSTNVIYINATDESDITLSSKVYEVASRGHCVLLAKSNCKLEGLSLLHAGVKDSVVGSNLKITGDHNLILDCDSHEAGGASIWMGGTGNVVRACRTGSGGPNISSGCVDGVWEQTTWKTTWDVTGDAFQVAGGASSVTFDRCAVSDELEVEIDGSAFGITTAGAKTVLIKHCQIAGHQLHGVSALSSAAGTIRVHGNVIWQYPAAATSRCLYHQGTAGVVSWEITNNSMHQAVAGAYVVDMGAGASAVILNNIACTLGDYLCQSSATVVENNNVFYGSQSASPYNVDSTPGTLVEYRVATGQGSLTVEADPGYEDVANCEIYTSWPAMADGIGCHFENYLPRQDHHQWLLDQASDWPLGVVLKQQGGEPDAGAYIIRENYDRTHIYRHVG